MTAYPSVNWWPGNLRPYESRVSFLNRFRELNVISARRCLQFLNISPEANAALQADEIAALSSILRESPSDIQALFDRSIRFVDCGRYAPPRNVRDRHFVRYCETCANRGYHSYLHEAEWLARCPFHMCELKDAWTGKHTGSIAVQYMDALNAVMQEHCKSWHHCDSGFPVREQGHVVFLGDWVARASLAAAHISRGEIWCSEQDAIFGDLSLAQVFGQLRALAPMPKLIEPLLTETGDAWHIENRQFPAEAKSELQRLKALGLSFSRALEVYQCIGWFSTDPPSFVVCFKAVQNSLRTRHGNCHCEWGLSRGGWESHWIRVYAEERAYSSVPCPFDVALTELDSGWGDPGLALMGRKAVQEQLRFIFLSHEMHAAGLLRYAKDAEVSSDGYLYIGQDITSCCVWVAESPLTEILDTASRWEIESAYSALSTWLDEIEQGLRPGQRDDPKYCVRLRETDDGLSLVRWIAASRIDRRGNQPGTGRVG